MNLTNIDLNKIRVFHSVIQNGSYQAAGDEMGLTRSAISQSMSILENQIGASLFLRKGKKLFPTKEAIELSEEFARYQRSLDLALRKVAGLDHKVEGRLRIGSYYEFAKFVLIEKLGEFNKKFPRAELSLSFDSPTRLQKKLETGALDLSFSIFPYSGPLKIESTKIFRQELVLVAPQSLVLSDNDLPLELEKQPLIEYFKSHRLLSRWIDWYFGSNSLRKFRHRSKIHFAASAEIVLEMVAQGFGIGVVPLYLIDETQKFKIKIIRPSKKKLVDYIWMNQFSKQFENSAHKEFYEFMKCNEIKDGAKN